MGSLTGKTALVTGANSGIGLEVSIQLLREDARVFMVARDPARGERALARAKSESGSATVSLLLADFSSFDAVRGLAADYRRQSQRLDILINNAGSLSPSRQVTGDGLEQTFQVNHLGAFLLTNLLVDLLLRSAPARVVTVSSVGHRFGTLAFDNLQFEKGGYAVMKAYGRSKLCNVLFTRELARRMEGKGVTANCLHPGGVATNIWSHAPTWARPFLALGKLFMVSAQEGGRRIVSLATDPKLEGATGGYYDETRLTEPSALARDPVLAQRLWEVSEGLAGLVRTQAAVGA
jgi:retinol dehydrogenase-14